MRAIHEKYDLIVVNFANPDMVGHTGDLDAAIAAVEAVDKQVLEAMIALKEEGGTMIVTADHGNCEMMIDPATGGPHTAHTTNPCRSRCSTGLWGQRSSQVGSPISRPACSTSWGSNSPPR